MHLQDWVVHFSSFFQPAQLCISKVPTEPRLAHGPPKPLELRKSPRHLMEAACKVKNVANTTGTLLVSKPNKKILEESKFIYEH